MVQGVGFRYFARSVAQRLGVCGYAKNLRDGRVEVYAIGAARQLDALREALQRGPGSAAVSGVAEEPASRDERFAKMFSIEFDD